mmetsp:Transcript_33666/g.95249  ORF Transcript_33666/g.95249 Transcript_33666/m.95249 type:complete len:227 (-) Transcript_33666:964-1644(-)
MGDHVSAAQEKAASEAPASYLIQHNIGKKHNVGTLARCATAFGVEEVLLVGSRQFNAFGAHGASDHVKFRHFPRLQDCRKWLKEEQGCRILGVEICEGAMPIQEHPFEGPTAFILGNEGQGMNQNQMDICDGFVYIPQYGPGTASLNVACAASIVLHHFSVWAGMEEREREGFKFVVDDRPMRTAPRGCVPLTEEELEEKRRLRIQAAEADGDCAPDEDFESLMEQ